MDHRLPAQLTAMAAPPEAAERGRLVLLLADLIGVALAGSVTPAAAHCAALCAADGSGPAGATVLAGPRRAPARDAACANGAAAHALDYDDTHETSLCHVSAAVLPGLLALAEQRHARAADVLAAYALGIRTTEFLSPWGPALNEKGVHSTGILGALSAAAACTWLLTRDPQRTAAGMQLAATMAAGLCAAFGSMAKPLQAGRAAAAGVTAAELAAAGFAAPQAALFGPQGLAALWLGPGAPALPRWGDPCAGAAAGVGLKPYPACLLTHAPIDAALALRAELGIRSAADVDRLTVTVHPIVARLADKRDLRTELDSRFSLLYCLLVALSQGPPAPADFTLPLPILTGTGARAWQDWQQRAEVRVDPGVDRLTAELAVHTTGGRAASVLVEGPGGSPRRPLDRVAVAAKFRANAAPVLGPAADDLLARILGFAGDQDSAQLFAALHALRGDGAHA